MDTDRYFNLQLTIQKLEEELSLYRNGTTGRELLDLIQEKDSELGAAKTDLASTTKELGTLKTNFATLIKSSRKTLADNESLTTQFHKTQADHTIVTGKYDEASTALATATETLSSTEQALQVATEQLAEASRRSEQDGDMISKLQEQGIGYVKKLNCQYSQIKDYEVQIKILENKLQCLEIDIWKDKEKITELQLEYREQSTAYLKDKTVHTETITVAHKQLFSKVKEVETLTAAVAELQQVLTEQSDAHKHAVVEKDDCIREWKSQAEHMASSHGEYVKAAQSTMDSREEHWKSEAQRLQKLNENDSSRIKKFESDRSNLSQFKRDMDTLKARNQELEDKIKRQEQFMKTRLLRDRGGGNSVLSAPEGSAKPKPTHSIPPARQFALSNPL